MLSMKLVGAGLKSLINLVSAIAEYRQQSAPFQNNTRSLNRHPSRGFILRISCAIATTRA